MSSAKMPPMKKKNVIEMQIQQRDALVVRGKQPRLEAVLRVQSNFRVRPVDWYCGCHVPHLSASLRLPLCAANY